MFIIVGSARAQVHRALGRVCVSRRLIGGFSGMLSVRVEFLPTAEAIALAVIAAAILRNARESVCVPWSSWSRWGVSCLNCR